MSSNQAGRLSRSPQPYRHRKLQPYYQVNEYYVANSATDSPAPAERALSSGDFDGADERRPEAGRSTRLKGSNPSSISGSEADDESPILLKGLPPPPLGQRKGLRSTQGVDHDSSAGTPGYFNGIGRSLSAELRGQQGILADEKDQSAQTRKKVERRKKRRRAELVRRLLETGLLGLVGAIVLSADEVWQNARDTAGELIAYIGAIALILLLYPLRVLYNSSRYASAAGFNIREQFRIPSSFDPAPFLYPVFLPVLIALSLQTTGARVLLSNMILCLSSIPSRLAPGRGFQGCYSVAHWCLASLPLIGSRGTSSKSQAYRTLESATSNSADTLPSEYLLGLYPLHRVLRAVLHQITSTSLLPAEAELLATGLINLLIHSRSPQAVILKALLLGGGITILVLCGSVLRWAIALARIPKWKFRRAGQVVMAGNVFGDLSKRRKNARNSDADEDGPPGVSTRTGTENMGPGIGHSHGDHVQPLVGMPVNSTSTLKRDLEDERVKGGTTLLDISNGQSRRHPSSRTDGFRAIEQRHDGLDGSARRQQRSSLFYVRSYFTLTPSQALFRKWLYAGYVYLTVLLIIFLGIRPYIERHALNGREPFGWAIGYLAGNIRWLRFNIVKWNLESWICLPSSEDQNGISSRLSGFVEYVRQNFLGAATTRLVLIAYFSIVLVAGMGTVFRLRDSVQVDTRRKVFHGIMVLMFLPATFVDPIFAGFSMIIVLALFLLLEIFRASQLPPLSKPLATFLTPYVDGRDLRGPVVVSHIFLLIGCAVPLWLSLSNTGRTGRGCWAGWDVERRDAGMVSGVICVGMGDAAASLIGRRFGRRKWPWTGGKSIEGSLAFWAAVSFGLCIASAWLWAGGWPGNHADSWMQTVSKSMMAAGVASLTEAVLTGGNDNVIVPIVLWLLVRGSTI